MRILMITALLPLAACHASWDHNGSHGGQVAEGKGTPTARTYDATAFTGVDLRGPDLAATLTAVIWTTLLARRELRRAVTAAGSSA